MQVSTSKSLNDRPSADMLIVPFWQGKKGAECAALSKELLSLVEAPLSAGDFLGKEGETLVLYPEKQKEKRFILLGLGNKEKCTAEILRRSYAAAIKISLKKKNKALNVLIPVGLELEKKLGLIAIFEGVFLSNYAFNNLKGASLKETPTSLLEKICFLGLSKEELALSKKTQMLTDCVHFTRNLVNGNADDVNPQMLSKEAKDLAKEFPKIKATIFDKKRIEKEKMGLLLAVNRSSTREPAFIILEYKGAPTSKETTAIVGKGITYDTGGLNIKTSGMETMKCDMAGSAVVLGTLRAAALLGLKANLIGIIPATENAIGPDSYKPGDVYTSLAGITVEISNTDAEGRLVLADALSYVEEHFAPTQIIDLATLTGGIVVALGEEVAGLFCNNDKLAEKLKSASEVTGERVWRMPLVSEYNDMLKSSVADIKNSAGRTASSITGALFLQNFIKKTPWAHLDIAGAAYYSDPKYYHPTKATGMGVRLLIELLS